MNNTTAISRIFIFLIMLLATLFHGSFFSVEYIAVTIFFAAFIAFNKEITFSKTGTILLLGIVLLYQLSSVFSGYNTGEGFAQSIKPLLLMSAALAGTKIEKKDFMNSLIAVSAVLGGIGLLGVCRIIEYDGVVYIYDGIRNLQSTMQYANSAAVLLICGIFAVKAIEKNSNHDFICTAIEIFLAICLLFTHSKIAIAVYVLLTILEQILLKKGISTKLVINTLSEMAIYGLMQFLIFRKLSFVAMLICVLAVVGISEKTAKLKTDAIRISRRTGILLITGVLVSMAVLLCFVDISTMMIRLLYYMDGIKALIQNPIFGLSPGGWGIYQYNYQSAQYFVNEVHNGVLQVGLDAGVPAMLLFIILLALAGVGLIKAWKASGKTECLYVLLIYLTLVLHGLLDFDFSYGNILAVLGICISYGLRENRFFEFKRIHKPIAGVCCVLAGCLVVSEIMVFLGENAYNQKQYSQALKCYDVAVRMRPYDVNSTIMQAFCRDKTENTDNAKDAVMSAYAEHPDNTEILLSVIEAAAKSGDFKLYTDCRSRLFECAPMQQKTYTASKSSLESFYQKNIIDSETYSDNKDVILKKAIEANGKMNTFSRYLNFGSEIDINSLK